MPQFNRRELDVRAREYGFNRDIFEKVLRLRTILDGNNRASVIFTNHYMISHGLGLIVIPENHVQELKKKLVAFYESNDISDISDFLKENCWKKMN